MALSLHFFCAYSAHCVCEGYTWGVAPGCKLLRLQRVLPTRGHPWHHGRCPSPSSVALGDALTARVAYTGVLMEIVESVGMDVSIAATDVYDAGSRL